MNTLNFNSVKRAYLTITLPDKDNTVLSVATPTKSLYEALVELERKLKTNNGDMAQILDDMYEVTAQIMSNNKEHIEITKKYLEECLEFGDILIFFNAYLAFIDSIKESKN